MHWCHGIPQSLILEGTQGGSVVQHLLKKRASLEQLSGPCSVSSALKVSQDRNTTTSLGNLFQCLTTVMMRNSFLFLNGFFCCCYNLCLVSYSYILTSKLHLHSAYKQLKPKFSPQLLLPQVNKLGFFFFQCFCTSCGPSL